MPVENLHRIPDNVTDQEACFTEPLAAACRIVEQQVRQCPYQAQSGSDVRFDVRPFQLVLSCMRASDRPPQSGSSNAEARPAPSVQCRASSSG